MGPEVAPPDIDREQRHLTGTHGVPHVRRVMDDDAGRLAMPRSRVAPPQPVRRQRDVDLDGRMRMQRIVRAWAEQEHTERDARLDDEGAAARRWARR